VQPFRIDPRMPPSAYRSFEVRSPVQTHYRSVPCQQADCAHHRDGWISVLDVATTQGKAWAAAIRKSGRRFTVDRAGPDTTVTYRFPAGQQCFASPHKVPVGRPEIFVVRDGDWRGNPTGRTTQERPEIFVERMAENLDELSTEREKG